MKRKGKKNQNVKALVSKQIKKMVPNALPSYKSIFGGHFKNVIHRTTADIYIAPASNANTVYTISSLVSPMAGITNPNFGSLSFQLNYVDLNSSAYQALYDQYRIVGIEVTFTPQFNVAAAAGTTAWLGEFLSVIDYDDANVPTSIQQLREYENVKRTNTMTKHVRKFVPRTADATYGAGLFTSYANQTGQWLDVASSQVQYFGVKWGFTGGGNTLNTATYSVDCRAMIEFKSVR
jgi:hypothetical protein